MLINTETLKQWTGYKSTSAIMDFLDNEGIKYFTLPNGEICLTEEAINARLLNLSKGKLRFNGKTTQENKR